MVKMSDRYIVSGSSIFSPILKAVVGATGVTIISQLLERALEVVPNQRAHLLRFQIVGVVVAGRKREGAEHDAALHLGAEALRARRLVELDVVLGVDAQAVADAVVAREIRTRLGGRE